MSWLGNHAVKLEEWSKDLFELGDEKAHAIGADIARALAELKGEVPGLEAEAKADAEQVAKDAGSKGVQPALAEAEVDAVVLGAEAARDVERAATAPEAPVAPKPTA